ncbi:MAG: GGDEF domain-containing protein [Acetanaerobacterium sp.]
MKSPVKSQFLLLNAKTSDGFTRNLAKKAVSVSKQIIPFILLFTFYNLFDILTSSFYTFDNIDDVVYLLLHFGLVFASVMTLFLLIILSKDYRRHASKIMFFLIIYCIAVCLWATFITLYSIKKVDSTVVYSATLLTIAALSLLKPYQSILLFSLNQALFLILFPVFQSAQKPFISFFINTTIMAVLAIIVSITRYTSAHEVYATHKAALMKQREIEEINRRLRVLVHTDDLTGLYNRRFLDDFLPDVWTIAVNGSTPLAVLMLDIDDFKKLNDYYGHQAGDKCLVRIAAVLTGAADLCCDYVMRYGGEEFAVIMPGASLEDALAVAEHIRFDTEALGIPNRGSALAPTITVSVGVYHAIPTVECSSKRFFSRADEAMYEAKMAGKNRVVAFSTSPEDPTGLYQHVTVLPRQAVTS